MKEIKRTRTIEEVIGYEAEDGTVFNTKEECEKYESTAKAVITNAFIDLMVGGTTFAECEIYTNFGYGGEEFEMAIIDIKDANDLEIANRYYELHKAKGISNEFIGKRVLVDIGFSWEDYCTPANPRTKEMLIEQFTKDISEFFDPEES